MDIVSLNGVLLREVIDASFENGITGLQNRWSDFLNDTNGLVRNVPDRTTIYRWTKGGFPRGKGEFQVLCSILDLDAMCLLAARNAETARAVDHLVSLTQRDEWDKPALRFLSSFFGRQLEWPPKQYAQKHYRRPWVVHDFEHDPGTRQNYYALVELTGSVEVYRSRPQVWHFAFKKPGFFRDRWLEYGIVERYGNAVRLFHINGHSESYEAGPDAPETRIETWFGPGHAVFRVASLHAFSLHLREGAGDIERKVRFPG